MAQLVWPGSVWLRAVGLCWALAASAAAADLSFQRIALHEFEDGPPVVAGYEYLPGETVWLGVRIAGFARQAQDREEATEHARLTWQFRATDPGGTLIIPPMRGVIDQVLRSEDKNWIPRFMVSFAVPQRAVRGIYRVPVTVHDEVAKTDLTGEVTFRVRSEDAPATDAALGVRDFRFLAHEDDRVALRDPVYKPGASVFASFEMIGYGFQGNNHFQVEYGLVVTGPPNAEGVSRTVLRQETAATESDESFYPQRWIPASFGFTLDPDIRTGDYQLVLTVRDKVKGTQAEVRQAFKIQ